MSERIESDVLIVGGGLAGLSLAHALASAGVGAVVVDREPPARATDAGFDGRTSAIALASQRLLAAVGLWEPLAADAAPILDIRVSDGPSRLFLHYDHRDVGAEPLGWIVENTALRRALHAATAKRPEIVHLAPATVVAVERGAARMEGRLADGRSVLARLAVAADGKQSPTRRGAGIRATEIAYGQTAIVCCVDHERPHRNVAHERFLPSGPFALLPMAGRRSSVVWSERSTAVPALLALDDDDFSAEMTQRFGDWLGRLRVAGRRWSYPLSLVHAERYVDHRLALVGDAAHAIHPIAGQGLNLGLRDVAVLAEVVVDAARLGLDIGGTAPLARYQRWRRFDALSMILATDGLNRIFSNELAPLRFARDLGLAAVDRIPPLKRLFMRHAMGLIGELPRLLKGEAI